MEGDQKRAFLAVIISGFILFGWQYLYGPKTQPVVKTQTVVKKETVKLNNDTSVTTTSSSESGQETKVEVVQNLNLYNLKNKNADYVLNNNLTISNASNVNQISTFLDTVESTKAFQIYFDVGRGLTEQYFNVEKVSDSLLKITSEKINGEVTLRENGKLNFNFNSSDLRNVSLTFNSSKKELENNQKREFIFLDDDLESIQVGEVDKEDKAIRWLGVNFNYHVFLASFANKKNMLLTTRDDNSLNATIQAKNNFELNVVYTKKEYDHLKTLGDNLHLSVDFGIWSLLAEPMLWLLQKFHTLIPNYGMAIILLTLLIRLVTFPLQYKSFKSMKKMQEIQPELTKLREKFKDDPQRMQKESMELFKRAGANPLGGCLPLLLQMPVFFALYKVLYSAVELVGAPFYFWINDLSIKDPLYILPILMAGAMFVQQKLSPTAVADPTQKKVMMFMPLIFALIMKDLPSGLCLYIFVSTVFGLLQQMFVYKRT